MTFKRTYESVIDHLISLGTVAVLFAAAYALLRWAGII